MSVIDFLGNLLCAANELVRNALRDENCPPGMRLQDSLSQEYNSLAAEFLRDLE